MKLMINNKEFTIIQTKSAKVEQVWVDWGPLSTVPEDKLKLWASKNYQLVHNLAAEKMQQQGLLESTALYKSRWQVILGNAHTYMMYTLKLTPNELMLCQNAWMQGKRVIIEDVSQNKKEVINAPECGGLYAHPYFNTFKVEKMAETRDKLSEESNQLISTYLGVLEAARESVRQPLWKQCKEVFADWYQQVSIEEAEYKMERRLWAIRYSAQDFLATPDMSGRSYKTIRFVKGTENTETPKRIRVLLVSKNRPKTNIGIKLGTKAATIWDFDKVRLTKSANGISYATKESSRILTIEDYMAEELAIWAHPLGLSLKLDASETTSDTFLPAEWLFSRKPGYAGNENASSTTIWDYPERLDKAKRTYQRNVRQKLERATTVELLQAYAQLQYYKTTGIEYFLLPDWKLCTCGKPISEFTDVCDYCNKQHTPAHEVEPIGYGINYIGKVLR